MCLEQFFVSHSVFNSAFFSSKCGILVVFIVIIWCKCRPWIILNRLNILLFINFPRISIFIQVWSSNKCPLFLHKFIDVFQFFLGRLASECLHSCVEGVHSTRHRTNKLWLIFVRIQIYFISICKVGFALLAYFVIWIHLLVAPLTTLSRSQPGIVALAKVYPLVRLKCFYFLTVFDSALERFEVVSLVLQVSILFLWNKPFLRVIYSF